MGRQFDIVKLGVASRGDTNLVKCQAVMPLGTGDPDFVEHFGEVDLVSSLGVTALPAPADSNGDAAEGFIVRDVAGTNGIVIGARDERTADITAQLAPGETCLHATGKGFESRVFCKEKTVSAVVGNKAVMVLELEAFKIAVGGNTFEMSKENGIVITAAGGEVWLSMKDGVSHLAGNKVNLGTLAGTGTAAGLGVGYGVGAGSLASTSVSVAP